MSFWYAICFSGSCVFFDPGQGIPSAYWSTLSRKNDAQAWGRLHGKITGNLRNFGIVGLGRGGGESPGKLRIEGRGCAMILETATELEVGRRAVQLLRRHRIDLLEFEG